MLDRMLLAAGGEEKLYVEDVFSTYLYTGNGSTQTITNGIDLAGKGGMVWFKDRPTARSHWLFDTTRGQQYGISSNSAAGQQDAASLLQSFNSNGFTLNGSSEWNVNGDATVSWTFRKAPKFFDIVTYTGTGLWQQIAHSLGVAPGCIIVKRTDATAAWQVYHRSNANTEYMVLNTTAARATGTTRWNSTTPTATEFTVGTDATVNASGGTYVAYLFAHDATADGVIQCGSFTADGSGNATVNLGWEPQSLILKSSTAAENWQIIDNMRGWSQTGFNPLFPNLSNAESSLSGNLAFPTATGFQFNAKTASTTYIYIAIRRGPMKTPTVGTSVFNPYAYAGDGVNSKTLPSIGFPSDFSLIDKTNALSQRYVTDRLRGGGTHLSTSATGQEASFSDTTRGVQIFGQTAVTLGSNDGTDAWNQSGNNFVIYNLRRAPGFFDVVAYTGTGVSGTAVKHNLGVAPELVISKPRGSTGAWPVTSPLLGAGFRMSLNADAASGQIWPTTGPTATATEVYEGHQVGNFPATTWVAYLFASCPGVSKVGSYTGNGSSQTINCGFSNGARFFLVKRTDSTGDWWVYDSARGIVAAADPALALNSIAAEVTSADAVDPDSTGIVVNQETTCNINVSGGTYIYLAIA